VWSPIYLPWKVIESSLIDDAPFIISSNYLPTNTLQLSHIMTTEKIDFWIILFFLSFQNHLFLLSLLFPFKRKLFNIDDVTKFHLENVYFKSFKTPIFQILGLITSHGRVETKKGITTHKTMMHLKIPKYNLWDWPTADCNVFYSGSCFGTERNW